MCMKNVIKFLLLSPIAFASVGCQKPEPKPVDVVLISGQSNAVGCTRANAIKDWNNGTAKFYQYVEGFPEIQIAFDSWTKDIQSDGSPIFYSQNKSKDDTFFKVMLGQGNSTSNFGPEIGIAEELHEKYANKLFLIKYACGASNLKDDWTKRDSPMYGRFINYKEFVTNVRTDLKELAGNKDMPFVDAGINNSPQWQYYRQVNAAKQQFAEESDINFYIDTIEAGLHTNQEPKGDIDTAHYDSESQLLLGKLFARQFEQFLAKEENK